MSDPAPHLSLKPAAHPLLPAWARFLIAMGVVFGANWLAEVLACLFSGEQLLFSDFFYRLSALVMLLAAFSFFLRVLDENESPLPDALTLPLHKPAGPNFGLGLALGAVLISLHVLAEAVGGRLSVQFFLKGGAVQRVFGIAVLLFIGALLEELSFRGYPFQRLVESIRPAPAIAVLSVLFGYVHLSNPGSGGLLSWSFFNTIAVGVLLAILYLRSRTLWMPLGFHFGWNFFQGCVFGLPVSGITYLSPVLRTQAYGPLWLTGGDYGPEASALCAVLMLTAIALALCLPARLFRTEEHS